MTREQAIDVLKNRYYSGVTRSRPDDEWRLATDTAIAALREPAHEWVRTTDRLPELGTPVLATDNIEIDIAMFRGSGKWSTENWNDWEGVVAWTPLPAMPKPPEEEG